MKKMRWCAVTVLAWLWTTPDLALAQSEAPPSARETDLAGEGSPAQGAETGEATAAEGDPLEPTWLNVRHEIGATLATSIALDGLRPAGEASFRFSLSYFFRIVPAWHVGAFLQLDQFGKVSGDPRRQRQIGLALAARWGLSLLEDKLEFRIAGLLGYHYIDLFADPGGHWLFFGLRPRIAWIFFRGLGVSAHLGTRLGYVAGLGDFSHFGVTLDLGASLFWAW